MKGARRARPAPGRRGDDGAAVVETTLVSALVTMVFLGVLQVTFAVHVRTTLVDCAAQGARHGALLGNDLDAARTRTRDLVVADLGPRYARHVTAVTGTYAGRAVVVVEIEAPVPVAGPLVVHGTVRVAGRALQERPPGPAAAP